MAAMNCEIQKSDLMEIARMVSQCFFPVSCRQTEKKLMAEERVNGARASIRLLATMKKSGLESFLFPL